MMVTRREFLDALALGAAGLAVGTTAKSYGQILGPNDRLNFAVIGLNGRGYAHLSALKANRSAARISHVCDVDSTILRKFADRVRRETGASPATNKDFRAILEQKDVDAITIATPDHWHTPMAIAGLQAGKHVYVEKPCSHNPAEGEMLVQAQQKDQKLVQMGNQQRSSPHSIKVGEESREGIIGRPYLAKAWYRSEEHTSELQSRLHLVCRLLLEKKKKRHLAKKLSLRRKRSIPNVFDMAATQSLTSIILIKLITVRLGNVRHPRSLKISVIKIQI